MIRQNSYKQATQQNSGLLNPIDKIKLDRVGLVYYPASPLTPCAWSQKVQCFGNIHIPVAGTFCLSEVQDTILKVG